MQSKKVPELKQELRNRGLPVSGNKAELIDRLTKDDEKKSRDSSVFVKTMMGTCITINISLFESGAELRRKISEKVVAPPEKMILRVKSTGEPKIGDVQMMSMGSRETWILLRDDLTLIEQGIYNESTLTLQIKF